MIGIIGAMKEEVDALKSKMKDIEERQIAKTVFYEGNLHDKKVVLMQSGIGKVNAAISTTLLCNHYPISCIINIGTAGGLTQDAEVLDLVISTEVVYYDVDATGFNYHYGQVPQMPPSYYSDEKLIAKLKPVLTALDFSYHEGLIVSGDSFIDREDQRSFIVGHFPEAIAVDMESTAIAQVAFVFNKPFIILRALSDIAGKSSSMSFDQFVIHASERSADLVSLFVKKL